MKGVGRPNWGQIQWRFIAASRCLKKYLILLGVDCNESKGETFDCVNAYEKTKVYYYW